MQFGINSTDEWLLITLLVQITAIHPCKTMLLIILIECTLWYHVTALYMELVYNDISIAECISAWPQVSDLFWYVFMYVHVSHT